MSMHAPLDLLDVSISTNHPHETLGLIFNQHMILLSCTPGTPAAKLKGWRQSLKGTRLIRVNGHKVSTKSHVINHIDRSKATNTLQFASHFQTPIHPETGTTQITFDQFVTIAQHHQDIRSNPETPHVHKWDGNDVNPIVHKLDTPSLTRTKLIKQEDWQEW